MSYDYTNCATCIHTVNLNSLEVALNHIFEQEGYRRISQPPLPPNSVPLLKKLRSQPWLIDSNLWAIGLFVGSEGWTIINTFSTELFCSRGKNSIRPRLSTLAMQVGCEAFHLSVHELDFGALLEVTPDGQTLVSGFLDGFDIETLKFHDEPIDQLTSEPRFFLLNVSDELRTTLFNITYSESNSEELLPSCFEIADRALGQLLVGSQHFWDYWVEVDNILYKAYAIPEKLEADGVRVLFFQVGGFDLQPDTEEFWEPITQREDYRIGLDNVPF